MSSIAKEAEAAILAIEKHFSGHGKANIKGAEATVEELLLWIQYLRLRHESEYAKELLDGAVASVIEAVAYIAMGLGRASITAIRAQIDLLLSFTYFRDHPTEWERVKRTGDGFMLRSAVAEYHKASLPGFESRLATLEKTSSYTVSSLYRILSAHMHGQTSLTIPKTNSLAEVVTNPPFMASIVDIQRETSVALSNYLLAVHTHEWPSLPPKVIARVRGVLGPDKCAKVFLD
jgi:hypothetical protein